MNGFESMQPSLRQTIGLIRSLVIYCRPGRQASLRRLYRPFVRAGQPVFDIGAHLGDRTRAFAALGASVVALEPQAQLFPWLRRLCRGNPRITLLPMAAGAREGEAQIAVSSDNPSVSSMASDWRRDVPAHQAGFRGVRWDTAQTVSVCTLDALIRRYGQPTFCKIDVEGYEAEVLAGLSRPIDALSLEFIGGMPAPTLRCLDALEALAPYRYNVIAGEGRQFLFPDWQSAPAIRRWLSEDSGAVPSGDLYARRAEPG